MQEKSAGLVNKCACINFVLLSILMALISIACAKVQWHTDIWTAYAYYAVGTFMQLHNFNSTQVRLASSTHV